jgi:hypothetical protein
VYKAPGAAISLDPWRWYPPKSIPATSSRVPYRQALTAAA